MPTSIDAGHGPEPHASPSSSPSAAALPRDIFVVSDLHLAAGRAPVTERVDPGENFFEDESFDRFLGDAQRRWRDEPAVRAEGGGGEGAALAPAGPLLVLNGDTFDFTRLVRLPQGDDDLRAWAHAVTRAGLPATQAALPALRARLGSRERRFGLGTPAPEAVWKLRTIAAGHPVFFQALRHWVVGGGRILFIRGNHDLELVWPAVQRAVRAAIAAGDGTLDFQEVDLERAESAVSFEDHGRAYANVWMEHGHRFEATTCVQPEGDASPTDPHDPERLRLPLGSLINIYLLNPIERWRPLLDNIKPVESALWAVFRYAPIASLGVLFRGATWLPPALRRYHLAHRSARALAVYLACLAVLWGTALVASTTTVLAVSGLLPSVTDWVGAQLAWFLLAFLLVWPTVGLARDLWRRLRPGARDAYPRAARDAALAALDGSAETAGARLYAVVGHTHAQGARRYPVPSSHAPGPLQAASREVVVLNTGTWIPIVDTSLPGAATALPRTRRPFVHLSLDHSPSSSPMYVHEHLQWDDARGEPAPSLLLVRD